MSPRLTILDHGTLEIDQRFHYPLHNLGSRSNRNPDVTWEAIPTFSMLLEHPDGTVVIDTGSHPNGMDDHWPEGTQETVPWTFEEADLFENRLEQVGYAPDEVDAVFQTHLHNDHAGNLDLFADTDVPVYAHREELEWAFYAANVLESEAERGAYVPGDYAHDGLNWHPIEGDRGDLLDGVEWIHLPGHAPGIVGLLITIFDEPLFVVGDAVFREGNILPEVVQPGANWDHAAWRNTAVPRILDVVDEHDPNRIHGHDPDHYNEYGAYPGVEVLGETQFQ